MMRLSQVAQWTGGRLVGRDLALRAVSTDTRKLPEGCLFVALRGEHFDGHQFVHAAFENGAAAVLVEDATSETEPAVEVADTREALGLLAKGYANQFSIPRVAVTGNAGKTTVKEMIAAMLGEGTLATAGNFNNDIGVPLTLLRFRGEHRNAVLELGANAPGEIAWTSSLVGAQVALVTNVTGAHLEGFGSMQGIADAKAEIFAGCAAGARAVINGDDDFADFFTAKAREAGLNCTTVSARQAADLYAEDVHIEQESVQFRLMPLGETVRVPLPGVHQVSNALMACAAVQALGVELAAVLPSLATLKPVPGRMNILTCDQGVLVDDTYNANPGSVRAAIDWLTQQAAPRVLVLGGLAELGTGGDQLMQELGEHARRAGLEGLIVMPEATPCASGFGSESQIAQDHVQAANWCAQALSQGGTVLVKGSRSARMEAVVQRLTNQKGGH